MSKKKSSPIPQDAPVLKKATRVKIQSVDPKVSMARVEPVPPIDPPRAAPKVAAPKVKATAEERALAQRKRNAIEALEFCTTPTAVFETLTASGFKVPLNVRVHYRNSIDAVLTLHYGGYLGDPERVRLLKRIYADIKQSMVPVTKR